MLFGTDQTGSTISIAVKNYRPTFYILDFKNFDENKFIADINNYCNRTPANGCKCAKHQPKPLPPDDIIQCVAMIQSYIKKKKDFLTYHGKTKAKSIVGYAPGYSEFHKFKCESVGVLKFIQPELVRLFSKKSLLYEAKIDPYIRFLADNSLTGFSKIDLGDTSKFISNSSKKSNKRTSCDKHYFFDMFEDEKLEKRFDVVVNDDNSTVFDFKIVYYDIEAINLSSNEFPDANKPDCPIITIGTMLGDGSGRGNVVFCYKDTTISPNDNNQNVEVRAFATEAEMILAFNRYVLEEVKATVLCGYNSNIFDTPYILDRIKTLGIQKYTTWFSYMKNKSCYHWFTIFESMQQGQRKIGNFFSPGLIHFDLFAYLKVNVKLPGYSLKVAATELLNDDDNKIDLAYKLLRPYWLESPEKRGEIAVYCMKDVELVVKIVKRLKIIPNSIEFSKLCGVSLKDTLEKGVSFKIQRKILEYSKREMYLIPTFRSTYVSMPDGESKSYTVVPYYNDIINPKAEMTTIGVDLSKEKKVNKITAFYKKKIGKNNEEEEEKTVDQNDEENDEEKEEKKKKKYERKLVTHFETLKFQGATVLDPIVGFHETPVATLDFASLYPSEMRSHNMCTSTLLKGHEHAKELKLQEGLHYTEVESGFCFVKKSVTEGLLCMIQTELALKRKDVKAQLKQAIKQKDESLASVLDAKQLAVKLIMNSIYGFCGSALSSAELLLCLVRGLQITARRRRRGYYGKTREG